MKKGFTLIELLVVVLIIGILSAVAMPQYTKAVEKARAAEAFVILKDMHQKSHLYELSGGSNFSCPSFEDVGIELGGMTPVAFSGENMLCNKHWCYLNHEADLTGGGACQPGLASAYRMNNANTNPNKDNLLYQLIIYGNGEINCYQDSDNYCRMLNL